MVVIMKTAIKYQERKKMDTAKREPRNASVTNFNPFGFIVKGIRKICKALYFLVTDYSEFRSKLTQFLKSKGLLYLSSSATSFDQNPVSFLFKRTVRRAAYKLTVWSDKYNPRPVEYIGSVNPLNRFLEHCRTMNKPRVLELGTKRSIANRSTRHDAWIPNAGEYLGTDIEAGVDVQVVADAHRLCQVVGEEQFDVIISCSTFEHLKYPHLAAHQLMKALKVGGILYIQTHQSFPLHAYPYDYFRFSREAMEGLFGTQMGFRVIASGYSVPLSLYSPELLDRDAPAFAIVHLCGEKTSKTPDEYIYEFDIAQSDNPQVKSPTKLEQQKCS